MNGKTYITAFLGITLVILSMRQDWTPEIDAVIFGTKGNTTAQDAHNMIKALGLELGFVVVSTMLADIGDSWGTSMVALMLSLLVLRGLFEIDLFAAFVQHTSLRPTPTMEGPSVSEVPASSIPPIVSGTPNGGFNVGIGPNQNVAPNVGTTPNGGFYVGIGG